MNEYIDGLTDALEDGDECQVTSMLDSVRGDNVKFLVGGKKRKAETTSKRKYRVHFAALGVASENAFSTCTGGKFSKFLINAIADLRPSPRTWPRLSISLDQGSDGVCWTNLLKRRMGGLFNVETIWDWSHGGWNDFKMMLKVMGLWGFFLVSMVVFNAMHGP